MRPRPVSAPCRALAIAAGLAVLATGCAPRVQQAGPPQGPPRLEAEAFITADGKRLPLSVWPPTGEPVAAIVALHGFNDYRRAFEAPAAWWRRQGVVTYAYDQRGFGAAPEPGIWAPHALLADDARAVLAAVKARHPGVPVYLLGESMGGAVVVLALAEGGDGAAGGILVAPALWGGPELNPVFRAAVWFGAHTLPWNPAGGGDLRRRPSDNIAMLRNMAGDPLVLKQSRLDAVHGLVQLMDAAHAAAGRVERPLLLLAGDRDEVLPAESFLKPFAGNATKPELRRYAAGWHMLLRDLQAEQVWQDVVAWLLDGKADTDRQKSRH